MTDLRIALSGASGTGKTTLFRRLSKKLSLPICPVGSRTVSFEMGFRNPYDVDAAGKRREFQRRLFESKRKWESMTDAFVADRSYFDNLAYGSLHDIEGTSSLVLKEYEVAISRYTHIFYLPLCVFQNLGDDSARKTERAYHEIFDILLQGLYSRSSAASCIPLYCPPEERFDTIMSHLSL